MCDAAPPAAPPNIVVVIADQWRAQAFGFAGDPNVKTPNMDALAKCSVNFANAISALPVCCPTRATMLTGQRALTHGVFMNDVPLAPDSVTVAKVLRDAGYETGYIGKWHVDGHGRSSFIPRERRQGFDYWKVLECTHDYNHSFYYDGDDPEKKLWTGYDAIAQTDDAKKFLDGRAKSAKPFFLVLAWGPPHDPYQTAPEKYRAMYPPASLKVRENVPPEMREAAQKMMSGYYAHCSALDDCIGNLRAAIRGAGLETNTIFIFTSDHGDLLGSHGGRNKQQPYDESIRVPLLVSGAGIEARKLDTVISSEDFMPTVLGLAGVAIPKSVQGLDFSAHIRGGKNPGDDCVVIECIAPFGQWTRKNGGREYRGIRTTRYTFVRDLTGPWLLFDNQADPFQTNNLANKPESAALQSELDVKLKQKLKDRGDEFRPGDEYLAKWGYRVDATGTVPYSP